MRRGRRLYSPPTHLMQMMRYAEDGSMRFLWAQATNPAVSLPELRRIRSILSQGRLFLVVQDIFLSDTAQLADVVLPAATCRDLSTGAPVEKTEYKALNPSGKAIIKAAQYVPPHEEPDEQIPFALITGRTLYHFHTRTKTPRAPQLQAAAHAGVGGAVDR